ncbi:MAG: formate--phosphoribosylaminoimidazolecarboxamide ligase [Candidatus Nitrosocaldaceae archaeon]
MNTISTLGSHCALQVLKGAKDEGFKTKLVCEKKRVELYKRFRFIDEMIIVDRFNEIKEKKVSDELVESVLIPHGTMISSMSKEEIDRLEIPFFGNKKILYWEADRRLKNELLKSANLTIPKSFDSYEEIDRLVLVKLHGAAGGKGYFLAWDKESFMNNFRVLKEKGVINNENELFIQEYVVGVPVYLQYFYSPINNELELLGIDKRYESNVDSIGRIPARYQDIISASYNVIGNQPLVLRESLLDEVYKMGDRFVNACKRLVEPGMIGPFCLEGVYDEDANFITFEFSGRIVAGTNLYVQGSPYSTLLYNEPMSTGRRIAREIKIARENDKLDLILSKNF